VVAQCGAAADSTPPLEYQVKAAFLLNFTKFVEWPQTESSSSQPFSICLVGDDPFQGALERTVEGETVNGRKLSVQRLSSAQAIPPTCQIVFAGAQEKGFSRALTTLGSGILTVGEGDHFLKEGGMIAFVLENRRVRFDVNQHAAVAAGLKVSSKLLNVARSVEK
jgi:YfiR/HmsC-like